MTDKNTGGPAFPVAAEWGVGEAPFVQEGMSLRDWLAGQALAGGMSAIGNDGPDAIIRWDALAADCYAAADAMIAEREK